MKRHPVMATIAGKVLGMVGTSVLANPTTVSAQVPIAPPSPQSLIANGGQVSSDPSTYHAISPVTEGFQFVVTLPDVASASSAYFPPSRPVYVEVSMLNTTDKPLPLLYPWPDIAAQMNLIVKTTDGKPVPLTSYGKGRYVVSDFSAPYILPAAQSYPVPDVPSHGALKYRFLLSRVFDFSEANNYQVIAKELIPTLDGKGRSVIQSNPLQFSVGTGTEAGLIPPFLTDPASP